MLSNTEKKTIEDFGSQWTSFTENKGYYASLELLLDIVQPFYSASDFPGKKVAEVGSGTGRIVNMLLDAGAAHVTALEPSKAFEVLRRNTENRADQITYVNQPGEELPNEQFDIVFSIGVLHHIERPERVVRAMYNSIRPGGEVLIWLYGHEGNEVYLFLSSILRSVTTRMPDKALTFLAKILDYALDPYIWLVKRFNLPLKHYLLNYYEKLGRKNRRLVVFDQLNPKYAKYYRKKEALALLEAAGFKDVKAFNRHGYSWTVKGSKD